MEPVDEIVDRFVVVRWRCERLTVVVKDGVIGLAVGVEFVALEITPVVAIGANLGGFVVFNHLIGLFEVGFVIDIEFDKHEIVFDKSFDLRCVEYGSFHLSAVDTTVAREVD